MRKNPFVVLLFFIISATTVRSEACLNQPSTSSSFSTDCLRLGGRVHNRRCQLENQDIIIGLDLTNCNLTEIPQVQTNSSLIKLLHLQDNFRLTLTSLCNYTVLEYVLLDLRLECPGGNLSWNSTSTTDHTRTCSAQTNFCTTADKIYSCPANSACRFNGPGCLQCDCKPGYSGYKCITKDKFPTTLFAICLLIATVIACVTLTMNRCYGRRPTSAYQTIDAQVAR